MRRPLPRIYPITDRKLSGLNHREQVERLIDGGATLIQLREKHLPPIQFIREAEAAWRVADQNRVTLIINDRVDIAMAIGASGVHLGQSDLPVEAARSLMKESIIGFSTHTIQQLSAAVKLPIDYLAFGPVFAPAAKSDHEPIVGLDELRSAKKLSKDLPLVAIGGVTSANLEAVLDAGADSVALISAVIANPSRIAQNMRQMLNLASY
jgi:thiamine-phosphate pyrophosphorylase